MELNGKVAWVVGANAGPRHVRLSLPSPGYGWPLRVRVSCMVANDRRKITGLGPAENDRQRVHAKRFQNLHILSLPGPPGAATQV